MFSIISGSVPFFFFADLTRTKRLWQGHDRHHQNCDDTQSHCHMLLQIPRRLPDKLPVVSETATENFWSLEIQFYVLVECPRKCFGKVGLTSKLTRKCPVFFFFPSKFPLVKSKINCLAAQELRKMKIWDLYSLQDTQRHLLHKVSPTYRS